MAFEASRGMLYSVFGGEGEGGMRETCYTCQLEESAGT